MFDFLKKKNNNRYEIIVPATSANLGPGFDSLGISLELFNHFIIKRSDKYEFINVKEEFQNENNLVIVGAKKTYQYLKKKEIPFSLEIIEEVPVSRGLGSSATCIIAGIVGAMLISSSKLSDDEIINIATSIEGHPDNVVPAYYGSLNSSVMDESNVYHTRYDVDSELIFNVLIPPFEMETKRSREVLPKEISYHDMVYSMSRAISIPKALEIGDIDKLFIYMNDLIHEQYRYPLIKESELFKEYAKIKKYPICISGSGSTLLMISNKSIINDLEKIKTTEKWRYLELKVAKKGTRWVEYDD